MSLDFNPLCLNNTRHSRERGVHMHMYGDSEEVGGTRCWEDDSAFPPTKKSIHNNKVA